MATKAELAEAGHNDGLIVLIPVFNDWEAVAALLPALDHELESCGVPTKVVLIDDGSTEPLRDHLRGHNFRWITGLEILSLRRNLGHQRALAIGLAWVEGNRSCRAVIVMDGDGEDSPTDVPRLVQKLVDEKERKIVFAERMKRAETPLFRLFYWAYRILHLLLTGIPVRMGNFSVIPRQCLARLVVVSDLWNHYAASVLKARLPFGMLPTQRATRLTGQSRMNFVSLVVHGLSAISVFGDRVGVRLLVGTSLMAIVVSLSLATVFAIRLGTNLAIPGWATYTAGILLIILVLMFVLILVFVLVVLGGRDSSGFLPLRDYVYFVHHVQKVYPPDDRS